MIDVNNLARNYEVFISDPRFIREKSFRDFFSLAQGGCAFSETYTLYMQCALLKCMGFGVIWMWVQILVPALISCVNLSKFYDLCKPVVSSKVEIKIMLWSEVLSHMQSAKDRTKHLLRVQCKLIYKKEHKRSATWPVTLWIKYLWRR